MPLRFQKPAGRRSGAFFPPPASPWRGIQTRLVFMVAALLLVLVAMFEARNPKYYRWLGFQQTPTFRGQPLAENEVARQEVETRLPRTKPGKADAAMPSVRAPSPPAALTASSAEDQTSATVAEQVKGAWVAALARLAPPDRLRLHQLLWLVCRGQQLSADQQQRWPAVSKQLNQAWQAYQDQALPAVLQMEEDDEKRFWLDVLEELRQHWGRTRALLDRAARADALGDAERQQLTQLRQVLLQIALEAVKDNTVVSRPAEYDAWFGMWSRLKEATADQLQSRSSGPVGFLQLFKQPQVYRGKVVTVRGTARMAYHVQAPRNVYDVEGYYVFVLQPAGGPNAPILVYCLETPPGFPAVYDKDRDRKTTTLNEEMAVTGYFYKNCAYQARDATRLAPLLMARVPQWQPPAKEAERVQLPGVGVWIAIVLGVAAVAVLLSVAVYMQSRRTSLSVARQIRTGADDPRQLEALSKEPLAPDPGQALQQLAQQDDGPEN